MSYSSPSVTASGLNFSKWQAGGPAAHLEALITANLATTNSPTVAPTVNATGGGASGGTLAAGTYYLVFTETNGFGETTASPESSLLTVAAGNIPQVTFPTLQTGNVSRNMYMTPVNGASGTEVLVATGITTATKVLSAPAPTNSIAVEPPTVNTTGLTTTKLQLLRSAKSGNLQKVWDFLHATVTGFNSGQPMSFADAVTKLRDAHTVFAMLATMCAEAGTLLDANSGTLNTAATGIGARKTVRTWP